MSLLATVLLFFVLAEAGYCSIEQQPTIFDNSTQSIVATQGESVRLECYAGGHPSPKVYWRRENNALFHGGSYNFSGNILDITSIQKEDSGKYFCVAENGVGRRAKFSVLVNVKFPPLVTVPRVHVGQAIGHHVDIDCTIEAFPPPRVQWFHNGSLLQHDMKYFLSSYTLSDTFTEVVLRFKIIELEDYGQYTCKAVNEMGESSQQIELFETASPVCPPACNIGPLPDILGILKSTTPFPALLQIYNSTESII